MKRCPQCYRSYPDDTLNFCLDDGSELLFGSSSDKSDAERMARVGVISEAPTQPFVKASSNPRRADGPASSNDPLAGKINPQKIRSLVIVGGLATLVVLTVVGILRSTGPGWWTSTVGSRQIKSIAVMPFVNASSDPDMEYLSDGITETLIGSLSQLSGLSVKAPSSVFRYKGKDIDARTIGNELNVQAILNGRVVQRGDDLTLYLSLVDAKTENQIWGKQYSRKVINLINVQTEVAQDVAENLKSKLSGTEEQKLAKVYTSNPEANQLYLLGRFHWNKRSPEGSKKAIEYFSRAITLDPNYALAYTGLADAYAGYIARDREFSRENVLKGREAAEKALRLDEQLGEAHASFGYILMSDYDFAGAEREFLRAIELNPNYALAHSPYGILLRNLGRFEEAISESRRAVDIEPLSPHLNNSLGWGFVAARRYDEAIAQFEKVLDLEPHNVAAYNGIGRAYAGKGDYVQAVDYLAKNAELAGFPAFAGSLRKGFATGGWRGYLRELAKEPSGVNIGRFNLAATYVALDDKDGAFDQLNKSFELREPTLAGLKVDYRFDRLRDDPRYHELLKKIGLPPD